jgi:UDP-N-acetylglucosamine transferase subunit ALG13
VKPLAVHPSASSRADVVVSVGTDSHPFPRLMDWSHRLALALPGLTVLVQHGASNPPPAPALAVDYLPHVELQDAMRAARAVVLQGGPATLAEANALGLLPLVVARDPERGEHVDDHQLRSLRRWIRQGRAIGVHGEDELRGHIRSLLDSPDRPTPSAPVRPDTTFAALRFGRLVEAAASTRSRREKAS